MVHKGIEGKKLAACTVKVSSLELVEWRCISFASVVFLPLIVAYETNLLLT